MANSPSSKKRARQNVRRMLRNRVYRSRVKTAVRRFEEALSSADAGSVDTALRRAHKVIDKAAKRGVLHDNAAARRKSRLARKASAAAAS
ncbi:MAG: 30S ribosomal protein S20 [Thermaerobacterales bacterium]